MNKVLATALIIGFVFVDFLFFHDILKPGESVSIAQYLTGFLSLFVFYVSARSLATN